LIALPPLLSGADHFTVDNPLPGVADTLVGGPGTVVDATAGDATATAASTGKKALETANVFHRAKANDLRIPPPFVRSTDSEG
jgi:hypothetical protein